MSTYLEPEALERNYQKENTRLNLELFNSMRQSGPQINCEQADT